LSTTRHREDRWSKLFSYGILWVHFSRQDARAWYARAVASRFCENLAARLNHDRGPCTSGSGSAAAPSILFREERQRHACGTCRSCAPREIPAGWRPWGCGRRHAVVSKGKRGACTLGGSLVGAPARAAPSFSGGPPSDPRHPCLGPNGTPRTCRAPRGGGEQHARTPPKKHCGTFDLNRCRCLPAGMSVLDPAPRHERFS